MITIDIAAYIHEYSLMRGWVQIDRAVWIVHAWVA